MDIRYATEQLTASAADVERAAALLRSGGLVAIPTETVYGLAADAMNVAAVQRIFAAKQRPHWDPLIVHVAGPEMLEQVVATVTDVARTLMDAFWPGPLTLLLPRRPAVPAAVTAGRELVGVRMPAHPVARALIRAAGTPLAAPSANRFGHVSPTTAAHVLADLDGRIDAIVDAGRCAVGVESTVASVDEQGITIFRAGGVSAAAMERIARVPVTRYAPVESGTREPESLPSPGVGIRHYATRATVRLVRSERELQQAVRQPEFRSAAVLLPSDWQLEGHAGPVHRWAAWTDAAGLAAELYGGLRALDAQGTDVILVPLPTGADGLSAAIRDRLEKASRPR